MNPQKPQEPANPHAASPPWTPGAAEPQQAGCGQAKRRARAASTPANVGSATPGASAQENQPISWLSSRRRRRVGVVGAEQVAQVEVGVAASAGVDVDVSELRGRAEVADGHAGLLDGLPPRPLPRWLAGVDVPARLDPDAEVPVAQQHDAHAARR